MKFTIAKGLKGGYWTNQPDAELDILTVYDRLVAVVFILSLIACVAADLVVSLFTKISFYDATIMLSLPFFLLGLMEYFRSGKWYFLMAIVASSIILYMFIHLDWVIIFFVDFTLVGSVGVVSLVVVLQRFMFYHVLHIVEYINVKEKINIWEKLVSFMFNIPRDLDTRNLTMDYNLKRASIPWREIKETLSLSLMIGTFLWIYISMNPSFLNFDTFKTAPMYIFTIVLYIPVIVMPWSIFRSLNVRIETKYRDFTLYGGVKGTLKRMVVPMFAAFFFILAAVNTNGLVSVFGFIGLSLVMNVLIIGLTSIIYYAFFESKIVDDVVSKWKIFRPITLMLDVGEKKTVKEYPGTPKRDLDDFGELVFNE